MNRQAKLNSVGNQDQTSETDRRLELAAELIARIAVRIATSGGVAEQQPDSAADDKEAA